MPYMPSAITKRGLISAVAAVAAFGGPIAAANAAGAAAPTPPATPASCPLSQPFAYLGDPSYYTLSGNGSLEQGNGNWVFNGGAKISNGDDPFPLTPGKDDHSLVLPAG